MRAGDGAAEQSRLAAERMRRLKRHLDQAEPALKPADAETGPCVVADRLGQLIAHGWFLLNDVQWPGRPTARLDHVLVGPGGVVVVDSKNWSGEVRVAAGVLWEGRFARTQSVEGALAQCAAVTSVLGPAHRRFARPLICLAGQPEVFGITNSDVAVAGADRVVAAVLALPAVLDRESVASLYAHLCRQLAGPATQTPSVKALAAKAPAVRPAAATRPPRDAGRMSNAPRTRGSGSYAPSRKPHVGQRSAAGMSRLLCLAAFVVFAVYFLPYWGL